MTTDKTPRRKMLEHAADLIDGDRNDTYGDPSENFQNIADLWNVRFKKKLAEGGEFTASDVADAMILVKCARTVTEKTHDTYADIAGYAACAHEIEFGEQPQAGSAAEPHIYFELQNDKDVIDIARELQEQLDRTYRRGRFA